MEFDAVPSCLRRPALGGTTETLKTFVKQVPVDNFGVQNVTSVTLKHCLDSRVLIFYRGSS